jgi:hypothetical protein
MKQPILRYLGGMHYIVGWREDTMTFAELLAKWNERDHRYGQRKINGVLSELSLSEADSVMAFRRDEINDLPEHERTLARATLQRWTAPTRF